MNDNKALFLDLDHTLIRPLGGRTFPKDDKDWEFISEMIPILKDFQDRGYLLLVVSNQGGIEAGHTTEFEFNEKCRNISDRLIEYGVDITKWYYSVSLDKESFDRKPSPGMAYKAALDFKLYLRYCTMVGDMDTDNTFAKNAYIGTYYDVKDFINKFTKQ
jgi:D-glycero-D-manno-heptose 1,7-bisphosphate phosphatase